MRRLLLWLLAVAWWFQAAVAAEPLRVLFIGNSYVYVNDLPRTLAALAEAGGGRRIEHDQVTPGGYTLERHIGDGQVQQKIQARKWDFVVLQEQSQLPVLNPQSMFASARKLHAIIRAAGAKTLFYLTWARSNNPPMQAGLNDGYFQIARELGAAVAPVGIAWQRALAADAKRSLHAPDGSHPNPAGTYLAACVFYATLLDQDPRGLPATAGKIVLEADEAGRLQAFAWQAVQDAKRGQVPVSQTSNNSRSR